mmetsp:Transcript_102131/g.266527  ORF Transcript_102131/g.266527 Transcript_102131/m.266527 type:complete len:235 (-) Transcript_102131:19-723(-)
MLFAVDVGVANGNLVQRQHRKLLRMRPRLSVVASEDVPGSARGVHANVNPCIEVVVGMLACGAGQHADLPVPHAAQGDGGAVAGMRPKRWVLSHHVAVRGARLERGEIDLGGPQSGRLCVAPGRQHVLDAEGVSVEHHGRVQRAGVLHLLHVPTRTCSQVALVAVVAREPPVPGDSQKLRQSCVSAAQRERRAGGQGGGHRGRPEGRGTHAGRSAARASAARMRPRICGTRNEV